MKPKVKLLFRLLNISAAMLVLCESGCRGNPGKQSVIQARIDANDILPAFHEAIYDQYSTMDEAMPALKFFLTSSDPWVRYLAAEDLYIAGDDSGCNVLLEILKADHPVRGDGGRDLRVSAAETLEKYHEKKGVNVLIEYLRKNGNLSVKNSGFAILDGLAKMAKSSLPDDLVRKIENDSDPIYVIYNLSFVNPQTIKKLAQKVFEQSKDLSDVKIDAAWALLKAGEREPYYSYLMDFAKIALAGETQTTAKYADFHFRALKILASIKSPENKAMLEDALNNRNIQIVEIALVNLIYNQGGSDKVKQYLLNQFRGPTNLLADSDFDMQLAAPLNDPEINSAAQSVDDRSESNRWAYFKDRKNWSIYTWIGDYTVDLNAAK